MTTEERAQPKARASVKKLTPPGLTDEERAGEWSTTR